MTTGPDSQAPGPPRKLQALGLLIALAGVAVIFLGQFEVLPRGAGSAALGGGLIGLGVLVNLRGRATPH